jgi:hypothetical protein
MSAHEQLPNTIGNIREICHRFEEELLAINQNELIMMMMMMMMMMMIIIINDNDDGGGGGDDNNKSLSDLLSQNEF